MRASLSLLISSVLLLWLADEAFSEGTFYPCPAFGVSRIRHSSSCAKYVQCFAGVAVVKDCAPGLHYSYAEEKCMSIADARCSHDQLPCPLYNDPTNLVYIQDDVQCGKYFLCYNNKLHEYNCHEGLHWDVQNQQCAYPEDAECELYEIVCPNGVGNVPHPFICNRYYLCLDGAYFPNTCPEGLVFDTNTMNCNLPENSVCAHEVGGGGTTTSTTTTTEQTTTTTTEETTTTTTEETTTTTTEETTTTTTEETTTTTTEETTTTTEVPTFECPHQDFEVFAHPWRGCKWYIICENGQAIEGMCPLYTFYSHRLAVCVAGICEDE